MNEQNRLLSAQIADMVYDLKAPEGVPLFGDGEITNNTTTLQISILYQKSILTMSITDDDKLRVGLEEIQNTLTAYTQEEPFDAQACEAAVKEVVQRQIDTMEFSIENAPELVDYTFEWDMDEFLEETEAVPPMEEIHMDLGDIDAVVTNLRDSGYSEAALKIAESRQQLQLSIQEYNRSVRLVNQETQDMKSFAQRIAEVEQQQKAALPASVKETEIDYHPIVEAIRDELEKPQKEQTAVHAAVARIFDEKYEEQLLAGGPRTKDSRQLDLYIVHDVKQVLGYASQQLKPVRNKLIEMKESFLGKAEQLKSKVQRIGKEVKLFGLSAKATIQERFLPDIAELQAGRAIFQKHLEQYEDARKEFTLAQNYAQEQSAYYAQKAAETKNPIVQKQFEKEAALAASRQRSFAAEVDKIENVDGKQMMAFKDKGQSGYYVDKLSLNEENVLESAVVNQLTEKIADAEEKVGKHAELQNEIKQLQEELNGEMPLKDFINRAANLATQNRVAESKEHSVEDLEYDGDR